MAFQVVKAMQADGLDWGEGYRPLGRQALAETIRGRTAEAVDHWLEGPDAMARRKGSCPRHLLSELCDIELLVPRTPALLPDRGAEALCSAWARDQPCHLGRLRARALDPHGRRGSAAPAWASGLGFDREPPRQDRG